MNKIEQMHLDATDFNTIVHHDVPNDVDSIKAASKSAEITEQIAIEFAEWIGSNYFTQNDNEKWCSELLYYSGCSYSTKELFQEFLKTKQ